MSSLIGCNYKTPQQKADSICFFNSLYQPKASWQEPDTKEEADHKEYMKWLMKLLVNGNFENFKGFEYTIRPSMEDWRKATAIKQYGAFLTISLPSSHTIEPEKLEEKLRASSRIHKYIFCAEFYSGEDNHLNKHYHIFLYGKHHKANTIKLFSRFFKITANFVDFIQTFDEETNNQKIKYIKGEKKEEKKLNVELDKEYRSKHNLKDYYLYNI